MVFKNGIKDKKRKGSYDYCNGSEQDRESEVRAKFQGQTTNL